MTTSDWKPVPGAVCPKCQNPLEVSVWESSDGAFEDHHYRCASPACGHNWWVDGPDA